MTHSAAPSTGQGVLQRLKFKKRNWYYYREVAGYFRMIIPEGSSVLELGSGEGDLLAALKPSRGVGIDASSEWVQAARERHPHLEFRQGFAEDFSIPEKFDFVILSNLVGFLDDVQKAFQNLHAVCHPSTRIVIHYYSYLWEPLLMLGDRLGLRMRQGVLNWLSLEDLENLLHIAGFETVKKMRKILFPLYVPLVSSFLNRLCANLPGLRKLCLSEFVVARSPQVLQETRPSVTLVVPCRNEKGNIEELVRRTPKFPGGLEMIFVDGQSSDGTREEILRVAPLFVDKNVKLLDQASAVGKGDAVRQGFRQARGDILIILDADISVDPEDTLKFYELVASGRAEFANGTRLVYPMAENAMRFLNILGNKFFSLAFTYLLDQRIKDTLCGTKALSRRSYQAIERNRAYFGEFDPFGDFDLLFGAAKLNLKILEVPVRYRERVYGRTKIRRFFHGFMLLGMCLIAVRKLKFR